MMTTSASSHARRMAALAASLAAAGGLLACTPAPVPPAATGTSAAPPAAPSTVPAPPPAPPPPPEPPGIGARVTQVSAAELGATWRPECPVGPEQLRRVELNYVGFDGRTHRGALIVNRDVVAAVIDVFERLQALGYPIAKMQTVEAYPGAEDELSMADNNTSAYNCRGIPGSSSWSEHAYGRAIDLNPLINPYIDSTGAFQPANAGPWLDRSRTDPGVLHAGDDAVRAFLERGWRWGGNWRTPKDYQHFELP